jgi:hypothetical protein
MANKIALFDSSNTSNPTSHNHKILAGNHYSVVVTNYSEETITVNNLPVLANSQWTDEKPPIMMDNGLNPVKTSIGYDIIVVIPNSVSLTDIFISQSYFGGFQ